MKVLYGALPKTAGSIELNGKAISNHCPQDGLNNGIVYISEDCKGDGLILGMSVKENMFFDLSQSFLQSRQYSPRCRKIGGR